VNKVAQASPVRMANRQHADGYFEDEDEDMTDLQPTFCGPIVK